MKMLEQMTAYCDAHRVAVEQRILYGLRYSALSFKWGCAILLEKFLGVLRRKMTKLLMVMHSGSIGMANRIWEERNQLGQEDQEVTDDQLGNDVVSVGPDKAEEFVDVEEIEEALITGECAYETEEPSDKITTC